ncbi:hypothetical protein VTK56DRAFT_3965 [Thermocarpiscus australiensis]
MCALLRSRAASLRSIMFVRFSSNPAIATSSFRETNQSGVCQGSGATGQGRLKHRGQGGTMMCGLVERDQELRASRPSGRTGKRSKGKSKTPRPRIRYAGWTVFGTEGAREGVEKCYDLMHGTLYGRATAAKGVVPRETSKLGRLCMDTLKSAALEWYAVARLSP